MSFWVEVISIAFPLFLLMDSIGNVPVFIAYLRKFDTQAQRKIIFRELIFALIIIIIFNFIGEFVLSILNVKTSTISIAGGIILFLIAIKMIFPSNSQTTSESSPEKEPFIVPLATPCVAGPAVLAAIMLYSKQGQKTAVTITAIIIAWLASTIILLSSTLIKKAFGEKGLIALERLMGLVLTLIAVQMFLEGLAQYMGISSHTAIVAP